MNTIKILVTVMLQIGVSICVVIGVVAFCAMVGELVVACVKKFLK